MKCFSKVVRFQAGTNNAKLFFDPEIHTHTSHWNSRVVNYDLKGFIRLSADVNSSVVGS